MTMLREIAFGDKRFAAFVAALQGADLTSEDLDSAPLRYFTLDDLAWGGFGVGADALLRSIVVLPSARGRGLGERIVAGLAEAAREQRTERLWLLTTSAGPFFAKLGWQEHERAAAPGAIASSRQFAALCPASSTLMVRTL